MVYICAYQLHSIGLLRYGSLAGNRSAARIVPDIPELYLRFQHGDTTYELGAACLVLCKCQ